MVRNTSSATDLSEISTTALSGSTIGLFVSVWGQIGVSTMQPVVGYSIGPPAERQYAVDPVGVDTIRPSALNVVTYALSTQVSRSIILARAPLLMTTSLSTV